MLKTPTDEPTHSHSPQALRSFSEVGFTIQANIPLATKNWFGTGGPARFYCEPTTAQQFQEAILYAIERRVDRVQRWQRRVEQVSVPV